MPINVSDQQLERSLLIARHKLRIRWSILAALLLVATLSLLFAANGLLAYFSQSDSYNRSMSQLWHPGTDWAAVHQQQKPQSLVIGAAYVWPRGNGRYDLAAEVSNPNAHWGVQQLDYQFFRDNDVVAQGSTTLLPSQSRLLTVLGQTASSTLDTIDGIRLTKTNWRYIPDDSSGWWPFSTEPQFQARTVSGDGSGGGVTTLPRVSWEAMNNTKINLRQVVWQIILRTSDRVDQVIEYTANNVAFGVLRRYEVGIASDVGRPDTISVLPISDVYNSDNSYSPVPIDPLLPNR
ncbi:MAG: hypothetical protein V1846_04425 [Candidatus Komeilibacteria bacterium]